MSCASAWIAPSSDRDRAQTLDLARYKLPLVPQHPHAVAWGFIEYHSYLRQRQA
jgi:hypothetical protein